MGKSEKDENTMEIKNKQKEGGKDEKWRKIKRYRKGFEELLKGHKSHRRTEKSKKGKEYKGN